MTSRFTGDYTYMQTHRSSSPTSTSMHPSTIGAGYLGLVGSGEEPTRSRGRGRVLLSGQDAAQRQMISRILQADGFEVVSRETGRDTVIELLRGTADLLLVNTPLSDCSAAALLAWTRQRPQSSHMTCMVMVDKSDTRLVAGLYDAGADFVITRRTELDLLPRKVAAALARRPLALAS